MLLNVCNARRTHVHTTSWYTHDGIVLRDNLLSVYLLYLAGASSSSQLVAYYATKQNLGKKNTAGKKVQGYCVSFLGFYNNAVPMVVVYVTLSKSKKDQEGG